MHNTQLFLKDLVAIDSVNPTLVPGAAGELAIGECIAAEMRSVGLDVEVTEVLPGRRNVVGVLTGREPGRTLMLCGHMDTVGVSGMTAPFVPTERDGRLYGRGAQDMKGGVAAMVGAAATLAGETALSAGRVIVAVVVDEEHASVGADALVQDWQADGAVVAEPTDLTVATGHKGFAWVRVETRGRAAHGSRPREGRDAILRMGRVLNRLEHLDHELQARLPHPLLGSASLHASTVDGGGELSIYPDRCVLNLERRTLVGEADGVALAEVDHILQQLRLEDAEFDAVARLVLERPAYEVTADHPLPRALLAIIGETGRPQTISGMSFWTDAAILARAGIPSVLFGPSGQGLHSHQEYVELETVLACRDVLVKLAQTFCRAEPA
jgi:acetylornithine deacetylase